MVNHCVLTITTEVMEGLVPNSVFIPAECLSNSVPSVEQTCSLILNFVHHVGRDYPALTMSLVLWKLHLWVSLHLKRMEHMFLKQAGLWVQYMSPQKEKVIIFTLFFIHCIRYPKNCVCVFKLEGLSLCLTDQMCTTSTQVTTRSPLRQARKSLRLAKVTFRTCTPPRVSSPAREDQIKGN